MGFFVLCEMLNFEINFDSSGKLVVGGLLKLKDGWDSRYTTKYSGYLYSSYTYMGAIE